MLVILVFASIQQTSNRLNQLGSNFVAIYSCMPQCKGKNFELSKFKNLGGEKCCMRKCWLYNYANSLCSLVTYLYKNLCGKTLNKGLLYIKPLTDPFRTCKIKLFKNIKKKTWQIMRTWFKGIDFFAAVCLAKTGACKLI